MPPSDGELIAGGVRMRPQGSLVLYTHIRLPHLALRASPLSVAIVGVPCALAGEDLDAFTATLKCAVEQYEHLKACPTERVSVLLNAVQSQSRGAA